jgi:hypothetical protein
LSKPNLVGLRMKLHRDSIDKYTILCPLAFIHINISYVFYVYASIIILQMDLTSVVKGEEFSTFIYIVFVTNWCVELSLKPFS